jgi:hypothetical protein
MNVNHWGGPAWRFLHAVTFNYPEDPSFDDKCAARGFFAMTGKMLPCKYCRDSYHQYFEETPIDKYLEDRYSLTYWLFLIHNKVNSKLQKSKNMTFRDIVVKYEAMRAKKSATDLSKYIPYTTCKKLSASETKKEVEQLSKKIRTTQEKMTQHEEKRGLASPHALVIESCSRPRGSSRGATSPKSGVSRGATSPKSGVSRGSGAPSRRGGGPSPKSASPIRSSRRRRPRSRSRQRRHSRQRRSTKRSTRRGSSSTRGSTARSTTRSPRRPARGGSTRGYYSQTTHGDGSCSSCG